MASNWENTNFAGESRVRIDELIKIVDYRKVTKMKSFRFCGGLQRYAVVWLPIYKDGKQKLNAKGLPLNIPFNVTNFDPETESFDKTKVCPFEEAAEKIMKYCDEKTARAYKTQVGYYAEAINRDLQENPPAKKGKPSKTEIATGVKDSIDSAAFTPIECHQLNYTIGQHLESIKETNYKKDKNTGDKTYYVCAHDKYGVDVNIKFNASEQGQGKYKVVKGERTPLTEEEKGYLHWNIKDAIKATTLSRKDAKVEAERILAEFMKSVKGSKKRDNDDSPDEDMPDDIEDLVTDKHKKKNKKSSKDDSPEDSPLSSPVDSPDDSPVEKKKKKSSKKDSPEDSPDDSPVEKKSKKKSSKKDSPEDDDDSPVEKKSKSKKKKDSPEDDDSPVEKKSKKKSSKKDSPEDEDDEDDLIDLDDDDDEDEDDDD